MVSKKSIWYCVVHSIVRNNLYAAEGSKGNYAKCLVVADKRNDVRPLIEQYFKELGLQVKSLDEFRRLDNHLRKYDLTPEIIKMKKNIKKYNTNVSYGIFYSYS